MLICLFYTRAFHPRYKAHLPLEDFEGNVACVVWTRAGALEKMQLECYINQLQEVEYKLEKGEDMISHVVTIKSKGDPISFEVSKSSCY